MRKLGRLSKKFHIPSLIVLVVFLTTFGIIRGTRVPRGAKEAT